MSGIYLHIPFCKQACHYCNFHFSTSLRHKEELLGAMLLEIEQRHDYLPTTPIQSIYLGGGTPSLLNEKELEQLFAQLHRYFRIAEDAEITLEANPDDLTLAYLQMLRKSPVNRLSIGIQSFFDEDLQYMNRAHSAQEAYQCLLYAQELGFSNYSIDLIYGSPTTTDAHWMENLQKIFALKVPHISCYCLTVEPGTALDHFVKKGQALAVDEEQAARQFEQLMAQMADQGYVHYEISNFALPDLWARHNSNYWRGAAYLGIGPSAHSFDGKSRQWNLAHNAQYIRQVNQQGNYFEREGLSPAQQYNEYILTALRTIWGCQWPKLKTWSPQIQNHFLEKVGPFLQDATIVEQAGIYTLSTKGKLLADRIAMELFFEEA
ncbi:MAG: radical SAM family heme chaperone HemW [Bacteroidota bacterium]